MKKNIIICVLTLILLGTGGSALWLFSSLPDVDATETVEGLVAEVEIIRDAHGIPHIRADNDEDAYFALGYVHAQDRLWQMDSMRRLGSGRLSEVIGKRGLRSDRYMRMLGLGRLAQSQYQRMQAPVRRALEAYAAGVNAWLKTRSGTLPPEFLALGYTPEPWRPADSLLWGKMMAIKLSGNWPDELLRARLAPRLEPQPIDELWPPTPAGGPVTTSALFQELPLGELAAAIPGPSGLPRGASNAWAVGGELTESGKPLLANDPHLGFAAPILWYLAVIQAPGLSVSGATVPGVPFTILGHNGAIAWGMTSTQADLEDLFIERVDPENHGRYLSPDGPLPFKTRREEIAVDGGETVTMTVRHTRHGPVISDVLGKAGEEAAGAGKVIALAATYLVGDDLTPQALYGVNRAAGWEDFTAALEDFHAPQVNLIYADTHGNIGFIAPGHVPIRRSGRGRVPHPGWSGEADWTSFVPFDELPKAFNPATGRIANANNSIVPPDYPYLITDDWEAPYRVRRILDLLDGGQPHSTATMTAIQGDRLSLMARHLLPLMLPIEADSPKARQALELLAEWDGTMARDRPEPAIFSTWLRQLNDDVYGDDLGDLLNSYWTLRPRFIASVLTEKRHWCDNVDTAGIEEDCPSLLKASLERALDDLGKRLGNDMASWRWGDIHKAKFKHPLFSGIPLIGALADLGIETGGGNYTVMRGASRVNDPQHPFDHIHGPGYRAVYDLSDLSKSHFMIATGQSGNPLSGHYRDLMESWRDGKYLRLDRQLRKDVLKLKPVSATDH